MRMFIAAVALVCAGLLFASGTNGQDKKDKEVKLTGNICCAKCELAIAKECQTVIVVKDKETKKDIIYYFDKAGHGKFHDDICTAAKEGTVTGTVKDVDKKKVITVEKV